MSKNSPFSELWILVKNQKPELVDKHPVTTVSKLLLVEAKDGVRPGFFVRYDQPYFIHGNYTIKKGETFFHDMDNNVINDVIAFYPIDQIPVSAKVANAKKAPVKKADEPEITE